MRIINNIKNYFYEIKKLKFYYKQYKICVEKHEDKYLIKKYIHMKHKFSDIEYINKFVLNNEYKFISYFGPSFMSYSVGLKLNSKIEAIEAIERYFKIQVMQKACE